MLYSFSWHRLAAELLLELTLSHPSLTPIFTQRHFPFHNAAPAESNSLFLSLLSLLALLTLRVRQRGEKSERGGKKLHGKRQTTGKREAIGIGIEGLWNRFGTVGWTIQ